MRQHKLPHPSRACHLSSFARGGMSSFQSALCFLIGERRLVNQQIGIARCFDGGFTWPSVPSEYDATTRPRRSDEFRGIDHSSIRQRHRLPTVEQPPHRALGDTHLTSHLRVESSEPRLFDDCITQRDLPGVLHRIRQYAVVLSLDRRVGRDLAVLDGKLFLVAADCYCPDEQIFRTRRSPESHRLLAALKRQRPEQSNHAKHVVRVHVREENVAQRKTDPVAHHLALCSFATVEQQRFAFAGYRDGCDVALDSRARRRCTEEANGQRHPRNIPASVLPPAPIIVRRAKTCRRKSNRQDSETASRIPASRPASPQPPAFQRERRSVVPECQPEFPSSPPPGERSIADSTRWMRAVAAGSFLRQTA